MVVAEAISKL